MGCIMSKNCVKFGILGCGMAAQLHADALKNISGAELAAVADTKIENAKAFAEKYGASAAYGSFEALLESDVDAVCICTPSGYHAQQAVQALEAKKHVVLEKPMAFTVADADKIIEASNKSDKLMTVILQNRFSEDVEQIRELIKEGAFGKLAFCDLYMKYWRDEDYYTSNPWRGTLELDGGGALMNQGIHGVDLMYHLAGKSKVVASRVKTVLHDIEAEDAAVAMLEFENGALGVIEASTCACPGFERRLEIIGTKGSVIFKENRIEKLVLNGKTLEVKEPEIKSGANTPMAIGSYKHQIQLENFVATINGEQQLAVTPEDAKMAVEIVENVYKLGRK